jgi:hypothetical protein
VESRGFEADSSDEGVEIVDDARFIADMVSLFTE